MMIRKPAAIFPGIGASTYVKEISGFTSGLLDEIHGRHGKPRTIDHDSNVSVKADIVQTVTLSLHLKRVALFRIFQCIEVGVSKQRVFFKVELSVECEQIAFGGQDKRINFHQRGSQDW